MVRRLLFQLWYFRQPPWGTGIGCGTGTNIVTLTQARWRVTGVDFVPRAIDLAMQKIRAANVQAEVTVPKGSLSIVTGQPRKLTGL